MDPIEVRWKSSASHTSGSATYRDDTERGRTPKGPRVDVWRGVEWMGQWRWEGGRTGHPELPDIDGKLGVRLDGLRTMRDGELAAAEAAINAALKGRPPR